MAIVRVHNKARNITYVYESVSYWDMDLKQSRFHRKFIGRIDLTTGNVVPTGKRAKTDAVLPLHSDTDYRALYEQVLTELTQKDALIAELRSRAYHCGR